MTTEHHDTCNLISGIDDLAFYTLPNAMILHHQGLIGVVKTGDALSILGMLFRGS